MCCLVSSVSPQPTSQQRQGVALFPDSSAIYVRISASIVAALDSDFGPNHPESFERFSDFWCGASTVVAIILVTTVTVRTQGKEVSFNAVPFSPPISVGEDAHLSTWTPEGGIKLGGIASKNNGLAGYYIDGRQRLQRQRHSSDRAPRHV